MNQYVMLTILGKDRPGIISEVTELLFKRGCNLEDISMTVLEGQFAMFLAASYKRQTGKRIQKQFLAWGSQKKLTCYWNELDRTVGRMTKHKPHTIPHIVSVYGADTEGIVYKVCKLLAAHKLNITDLNSKILGTNKKSIYMMFLEVDIPKKFNLVPLKAALERLGRKLNVECRIKPAEPIEI